MIFLTEAVVCCILFAVIIISSVNKNPMMWIADYPPAIREKASELGLVPEKEPEMPLKVIIRKIIASIVMTAILILLLIHVNGAETFREGFLLSYGLWMIVDWFDALFLDCIWFANNKKIRIPGTEDMDEGYHDYWFHIKMSLIGMLIGLPVCLLAGLGVMIFA